MEPSGRAILTHGKRHVVKRHVAAEVEEFRHLDFLIVRCLEPSIENEFVKSEKCHSRFAFPLRQPEHNLVGQGEGDPSKIY